MQNNQEQPDLKRTEKFRARPVEIFEYQYPDKGLNRASLLLEQRKLAEAKKEEGRGKVIC